MEKHKNNNNMISAHACAMSVGKKNHTLRLWVYRLSIGDNRRLGQV